MMAPASSGAPRWGVVATVDEPAPLVLAFAAWHLQAGASEVHLFLDRPDPELAATLDTLPGCHVVTCDAAYWARHPHGRPQMHTARQAWNAGRVYADTGADWLLHADADEFVADGAWLARTLAALPADTLSLRLLPLERVRRAGRPQAHLFDGLFRAPGPGGVTDPLHGRFAKFLDDGFTGHKVGKALTRTGQADLALGIHFAKRNGTVIPEVEVARRRLLHFDGLTPLHYAVKLARRAQEPASSGPSRHGAARQAQIRYMRNKAGNAREVRRLVDAVQAVTVEQEAGAGGARPA